MRLVAIILIVLFAIVGVAFGALNADLVSYDVAFATFSLPKGAALIAALLLGWILGGLVVWLTSVAPARRQLRNARKQLAAAAPVVEADAPTA